MSIYSQEIVVAATVYIRADNAQAAKEIAKTLNGMCIEGEDGDIPISGLKFDNPALPDLSVSPSMTVMYLDTDAIKEVE